MRPDEDPDPRDRDDALVDGLAPTHEHGDFSTSGDPYGDGGYGTGDGGGGDDGGYGTGAHPAPGDGSGDGHRGGDDDGSIFGGDTGRHGSEPSIDDLDLTIHHGSPLEGLGYLADAVHDALFGHDDGDGGGHDGGAEVHDLHSVFDPGPDDGDHHGGLEGGL